MPNDPVRELIHALPALIDEAAEAGLPVVLERTTPLTPHAQRLMDTLGVEVRIVSDVTFDRVRRSSRGRPMGHFDRPPDSSTNGAAGPRADWIDFRASIARTFKRKQAGELPIQCEQCDTELDVDDVVHSPKCPVFLGELPKTKAADWDTNAVITAIRLWAGEHDDQAPSSEQWRRPVNGFPSYGIVVQLFGSWNDGIEAAGFEPRAHHRERLEEREPEAEQVLAGTHDSVTQAGPTAEPASRSSSRTAAIATPEGVRRRTRWTADTVRDALRAWASEHGRPPKTMDAQKRGSGLPDPSYASRFFGGWRQAIEAAGLGAPARSMAEPVQPTPEPPVAEPIAPEPEPEPEPEPAAPPDHEELTFAAAALALIGAARQLLDVAERELRA